MTNVKLDEKKCGSCQWWSGEREIKFFCRKPEKIACEGSSQLCRADHRTHSASWSCREWVKWNELP